MRKLVFCRNTFFLSLFAIPLLSTSCSTRLQNIPTGNIVWANYESYMNTDVMDSMSDKVTWLNYSTDDDIMNKFSSNYDLAIPSISMILTLISKDLLSPVAWELFELKDANGDIIDTGKKVLDNLIAYADINNGKDGVDGKKIIESIDQYLISEEGKKLLPKDYLSTHDDSQISILDWVVPYFLSTLSFAYWNDDFANTTIDNNWTSISQNIKDKAINNPYNKFALIDDYRTIYDVAQLYANKDINPPASNRERDFSKTYNELFNSFGNNKFYLNTDSVELANSFLGDINSKHAAGIFSYNGDVIYGSVGLGQINDEKELSKKWIENVEDGGTGLFSCATPEENVLILDGVVFNKYLDLNENRKAEAYDIVKQICLDHVDFENPDYATDDTINAVDENDEYIYDSFLNFDYILYTSPWEAINNIVYPNLDPTDPDYTNGYFEDLIYWLLVDETELYTLQDDDTYIDYNGNVVSEIPDLETWVEYLKSVYRISYPSAGLDSNGDVDINQSFYIELSLSGLQKSDMHWAYEKNKYHL